MLLITNIVFQIMQDYCYIAKFVPITSNLVKPHFVIIVMVQLHRTLPTNGYHVKYNFIESKDRATWPVSKSSVSECCHWS